MDKTPEAFCLVVQKTRVPSKVKPKAPDIGQSAHLDVHAYIILTGNRKYGNSRVRSTSNELSPQEVARLSGGDIDSVVAVTLDITELRAYMSRTKRALLLTVTRE